MDNIRLCLFAHVAFSVFFRGQSVSVTIDANVGDSASFSIPPSRDCHNHILYDPHNISIFRTNKYGNNLEHWASDRADFNDSGPLINFTILSVLERDEGEYKFVSASQVIDRECIRFFRLKVHRPVNGGWSEWTDFGSCSVTCGRGQKQRNRSCTRPRPENGGSNCAGQSSETQECLDRPCPVNGEWSEWTEFGSCSVTCDLGQKGRSRSCSNPKPKHGGRNCAGQSSETQTCIDRPCPVNGGWSEWTKYGSCSVTCGRGQKERNRSCTNPRPENGGRNCSGQRSEKQECLDRPCPVDGRWTEWSDFGLCSAACGIGQKMRSRYCTNPVPSFGGNNCIGSSTETQQCQTKPCPVEATWSQWTEGECSVSCGEGTRNRHRECLPGKHTVDNRTCIGSAVEAISCKERMCPVDGSWSLWSNFSSCSISCGHGIRTRIRNCSDPHPQFGGKMCPGDRKHTELCKTRECPVDGAWSMWSTWTLCPRECDSGVQNRTRECDRPEPQYGGKPCTGNDTESRMCRGKECEPLIATPTSQGSPSLIFITIGVLAFVIVTVVVGLIVAVIIKKNSSKRASQSRSNPGNTGIELQNKLTIENKTYPEPDPEDSHIYSEIPAELSSFHSQYEELTERCSYDNENPYTKVGSDTWNKESSEQLNNNLSANPYLTPQADINERGDSKVKPLSFNADEYNRGNISLTFGASACGRNFHYATNANRQTSDMHNDDYLVPVVTRSK